MEDDNSDPHARECYSCEYASSPPASTPQCKGCINKESRPRWVPRAEFKAAAAVAIKRAMQAL